MGYKYDRGELLAAAVEAVLDDGLSRLTFGRLANRLGINDRSIVYYFPSKPDLIGAVAVELGARMQSVLEEAFGAEPLGTDELLDRSWPILASPAADRFFAVYFELVGLAAAGIEPFDALAPPLIEGWIDWLEPRVADDDATERRAGATAVIAVLDGLLLLRHTSGRATADHAAARLGIGASGRVVRA